MSRIGRVSPGEAVSGQENEAGEDDKRSILLSHQLPCPGAVPVRRARGHADPAVVKFEIERITGADLCRFGQHPRDTIADHDVAAREQAFVTFRVWNPVRNTI
jgi:hypothetical protein